MWCDNDNFDKADNYWGDSESDFWLDSDYPDFGVNAYRIAPNFPSDSRGLDKIGPTSFYQYALNVTSAIFQKSFQRIARILLSDPVLDFRISPIFLNSISVTDFRISPVRMDEPVIDIMRISPGRVGYKKPISHSHEWDIQIDGVSIRGFTAGVEVSYNEESIHNGIKINVLSNELWATSLPIEIDLITNGITETWIIENLDGDPQRFQWWGRSLSAYHAVEFGQHGSDTSGMASDIAKGLISALQWGCNDWLIKSFEFTGAPIDAVAELAGAVGAVVRCDMDGNVIVRNRLPVRPIDIANARQEAVVDANNMNKPVAGVEVSEGINGITVQGPASSDQTERPDIIIESDPTPEAGQEAYVQVYFKGQMPSGLSTMITAGNILYDASFELEKQETVHFENGFASVSKPIKELLSWAWQGNSAGTLSAKPYATFISSSETGRGVADIVYISEYHRFVCRDAGINVLEAIGTLLIPVGGGVSATVIMGEGDNIAPSVISENRIENQNVAIQRATAELDNRGYDFKTVSLISFSEIMLTDGQIILVDNPKRGLSANYHIRSVTRNYRKNTITANIEAVTI